MRNALLALPLALLVVACEEKKQEGANEPHNDNPVIHQEGKPAPTEKVHGASAVTDTTLRAAMDAGTSDAGVQAMAPSGPPAEVEISGTVKNAPKGSELKVVINKRPCGTTMAEPLEPYMVVGVKNAGKASRWETEIFVRQGSSGNVCAFALVKGQVVAAGASDKPMMMQGEGEVVFTGMDVTLEPKKPAAPPAGLVK